MHRVSIGLHQIGSGAKRSGRMPSSLTQALSPIDNHSYFAFFLYVYMYLYIFAYILWHSFVFLWDSWICNKCVSVYFCFLYLFLGCFPSVWFVLFQLVHFHFIFCYILFHYYPLDACLVSKKKLEKKADLDGGKEGGTGRNTGRGNYNQNIVYERNLFTIKEKGKQHQ